MSNQIHPPIDNDGKELADLDLEAVAAGKPWYVGVGPVSVGGGGWGWGPPVGWRRRW